MSKDCIIQMRAEDGLLIQKTDAYSLNDNLSIEVPKGYQAVLILNGRPILRKEACKVTPISKDLRGYTGDIHVLYTAIKSQFQCPFGVGGVSVNYKAAGCVIKVGGSGYVAVRIDKIHELEKQLENSNTITERDVASIVKSKMRPIIEDKLRKIYQGEDDIYKIESETEEIRKELLKVLKTNTSFISMGLKVEDVTFKHFVNEEDRKKIDEILSTPSANALTNTPENISVMKDDIALIKEQLGKILGESNYSDEMIDKEALSNIKVTAQFLIDNASNQNDLSIVAGLIYSSVEDKLINEKHILHIGKCFAISQKDYVAEADRIMENGEYLLKKFDSTTNTWTRFFARKINPNDPNSFLEMPVSLRFYRAGLSFSDSKKGLEYWNNMNKFRHRGQENLDDIEKMFGSDLSAMKKYFVEILEFFRRTGLYTRD